MCMPYQNSLQIIASRRQIAPGHFIDSQMQTFQARIKDKKTNPRHSDLRHLNFVQYLQAHWAIICTGKWVVPPEIHCQTLPRLFDARHSLPQRLISDVTVELPAAATKPPPITELSSYSVTQLSKDIHMTCSNAAQYIQQLTSQAPHPLLAPSPRFAPATLMVHTIILSNLSDTKDMPTDTFEKFLLTSHQECSRSDSGNMHHEL